MKKLVTLSLLLIGSYLTQAQSVIYSQNFESTYADWSLSTSDLGGTTAAMGSNVWIINNSYTGLIATTTPSETAPITGAPNSNYMHINCGSTLSSFYGTNDNFLATGSGETYFTALNTPLNTTGYTNVYFSFYWICAGDATSAGKVYYRTSSGGAWTQVMTPLATFYNNTTWTIDSFHLAAFDGQAFLEFGFQFTDGDGLGSDPAFGIDQIMVTGTPGSGTSPVASFTSPSSSTCADSCISFTSTSTGTVDSVRWAVSPSGPTVAVPTSSVTSICFPASGTYSVMLTAYGSGTTSSTSSSMITINPAPHPTVTQVGHVLSVPAVYTSYQWDSNAVAIAGANTSSYTYTVDGPVYTVVVDSAGCMGTSTMLSTLGILPVNAEGPFFWVSQRSGAPILWSNAATGHALQVAVYDMAGRQMATETMPQGTDHIELSVPNLSAGLYIIRIFGNNCPEILKWTKQ